MAEPLPRWALLDPKSYHKQQKQLANGGQGQGQGRVVKQSISKAQTPQPTMLKPASNENVKTPAAASFHPRQLLNPRSFQTPGTSKESNITEEDAKTQLSREAELLDGSSTPSSHDGVGTPSSGKRSFDDFEEGPGLGSIMDKLHNVESRSNVPQKKVKQDQSEDEEVEKNMTMTHGSGALGDFMKEGRDKDDGKIKVPSTIDLTADDDDEVIVVSENHLGAQEVCYGRIQNAFISAHRIPKPTATRFIPNNNNFWPIMKVEFRRLQGQRDTIVRAFDTFGTEFGRLDNQIANALSKILDSPMLKIRLQAFLPLRVKKPNDWPGQPCSEVINSSINIYGPRMYAQQVGKWFGQHNIWLQNPQTVEPGIHLVNPHANRVPTRIKPAADTVNFDATVEDQNDAMNKMFDNIKVDEIPTMEPPDSITTQLLKHQKQGLYWMTEREKNATYGSKEEENNTLWTVKYLANGRKYFYHLVTQDKTYTEPEGTRGGILADMMGLGKTLSILSLVLSSMPEAIDWAAQPPVNTGPEAGLHHCKTTLLVSPLSALVNWEEQIKAHIQPDGLTFYTYHGPNRLTDFQRLAEYDVILTTYGSVLSDVDGKRAKDGTKGRSPLMQMNFFRIVLDEAHIIREQSSGTSQAACMLAGQRRWCVTGTPVQNRLDDLGSLLKFLRLRPFDDRGVFSRSILAPFKMLQEDVIQKIQVLVSSIALRRLKDRIDLPARKDQVIRLKFDVAEQALHDFFRTDSERRVKLITGNDTGRVNRGMYHHILNAITKLRQISAHGKELLNEEDLKRMKGLSVNDAIDLDDEENGFTLTPKTVHEMFSLALRNDQHHCAECDELMEAEDGKEETIGHMLTCFCMVCRECYVSGRSPMKKLIGEATEDMISCPYDGNTTPALTHLITRSGLAEYEKNHNEVQKSPRQTKALTHYSGPHTKTKALIQCLKESAAESENLPAGEPPIKSVVFSGWTSHLNLIQIALEDNTIQYTRLDGSMSRAARTKSLETFATDSTCTVLLVTVGAGGVGLNLTAGSRVYVMEPQYNPAAESQAIDRIHRLGQKREVVTTRFIMEGSIEEKIRDLQKKKENLAELSMERGRSGNRKENQLQRLQELRSLFK